MTMSCSRWWTWNHFLQILQTSGDARVSVFLHMEEDLLANLRIIITFMVRRKRCLRKLNYNQAILLTLCFTCQTEDSLSILRSHSDLKKNKLRHHSWFHF